MAPSLSLQYYCLSPDNGRKPIRLLELLPCSTAAALKCRLIHVFLADNPPYEALSYCWGDNSNPVTIQCDTGRFWLHKIYTLRFYDSERSNNTVRFGSMLFVL
ncbi:hypothetical protein DL95DRAFT_397053, partial [Leptodontidium sp. 2 PMI_412]